MSPVTDQEKDDIGKLARAAFGDVNAAGLREATARPMFILQRREIRITEVPPGCSLHEDGMTDADGNEVEDPEHYCFQQECAVETWLSERVLGTRAEAEALATRRTYNYPQGFRVYCVPAEGALGDLLAQLWKDTAS